MIEGFAVLYGDKPQAHPTLSVTENGLYINAAAMRMLGKPTRVQIGIDGEGYRLAICPVTEGGIAINSGHTGNKGIVAQVLRVLGRGTLHGRLVDGGMLFEAGEED